MADVKKNLKLIKMQRCAQALRENLRKRKAQKMVREESKNDDTSDETDKYSQRISKAG